MASHPPPHSSDAKLRIVFMGTPALAARVLERLISASGNSFQVVGVVTRPDQPRGRGMKLEPSEVGAVAASRALPTLKPTKIRTAEFLAKLTAFNPDLLVVAAYGRILPNPVLEAARLMPINVHASLLPRYRGAAPIEGAILGGERESGVTIMRITEQMDAGPILLQRAIPLAPDETQGSLKAKLAELGADALLEALALLVRGELREIAQDESRATYTSLIKKEDATVNWTADAIAIERTVRAFDPWPVARMRFNGDELLLWKTAFAPDEPAALPGELLRLKPTPIVRCGRGSLELLEVQAQGRRRMSAAEFFRGKRALAGMRFG
jgi:methionyl-tRNA formyltransferase